MAPIANAVVFINVLTPEAGKMDELVECQKDAQKRYAGSIDGLMGSRLHRALDGKNIVVTTIFESIEHHRRWLADGDFLKHSARVSSLIAQADSGHYEIVAESGRLQD